MGGSDEIYVVNARAVKSFENFGQMLFGNFPTEAAAADFFVLAKNAAEIAARKENRPRAFCAAYAGLFPKMSHDLCHSRFWTRLTKTDPRGTGNPALSRAKKAKILIFIHCPRRRRFRFCRRCRRSFRRRRAWRSPCSSRALIRVPRIRACC